MAKKKYYAVKKGRKNGIFETWDECKESVNGFSNAQFKSFGTIEEAENYMSDKKIIEHEKRCIAYVDGSYNAVEKIYGYGVIIYYDGNKEWEIGGAGIEPRYLEMWNVGGELVATMTAVEYAINKGYTSIDIYYDYEGIEKWARHLWKRNKIGTQVYTQYMDKAKKSINIYFHKVAAHTGVEGNELADKLAKQGASIQENLIFENNI